ncbi:multiheme c-type cytochrome [Rhodopirellula bahusiensis]|uniref:multiheme c-type cytochrome n=3 Tax=Rhodopirellula bahusiensis TaxID=2014065 RepID=UPI0032672ACA
MTLTTTVLPNTIGKMPEKLEFAMNETDRGNELGYLGPDACRACHPDIFDSFRQTAHARTSEPVAAIEMPGQYVSPRNRMTTSDEHLSIEMLHLEDEYYQRVRFYDWHIDVPMQISFGSGKMARSFAYWNLDRLYQHNVTYLSENDRWINSPGFVDGDAAYARPIPTRCLDCHATYFEPIEDDRADHALKDSQWRPDGGGNRFNPHSIIWGVSCERCHGPAGGHVTYHEANPDESKPRKIVRPSELDRERQLDICGQCHAGSTDLRGEPFQFRPGDKLSPHYIDPPPGIDEANSVHTSNQLARLKMGECFRQSQMTCADCHDPHQVVLDPTRYYSDRCLSCHSDDSCHFDPPLGFKLSDDCVSCHMPSRPTGDLRSQSVKGDIFPVLKDHFIRVDQLATDDFLEQRTEKSTASH